IYHSRVDPHPPARGQTERGDPPVLHAGRTGGLVHRCEGGLSRTQVPTNGSVDVHTVGGEHHAGRVGDLPATFGGDHHAVRARGQRHAVPFTELGGVGRFGVDLGDPNVRIPLERFQDRRTQQLRVLIGTFPVQRCGHGHPSRSVLAPPNIRHPSGNIETPSVFGLFTKVCRHPSTPQRW